MDQRNDDSANADYCRRHDLYARPYAHDPRDTPGGAHASGVTRDNPHYPHPKHAAEWPVS